MSPGKVLFAGAAFSACLFLLSATAFAAPLANCQEPKAGTKDAPIFSPPRAAVVVGVGRLQFYAAPRKQCPISGIFVVPKDQLVVYAQTDDGWSSVMFINRRTGDDVSGWVRSARLKDVGTVGPKQ
jgi:hypothetical protein